jgi:hypothetical protein
VCVDFIALSLSLSLYCDFVLAPIYISYDDVSGHTKRSVERGRFVRCHFVRM